MSANRILHTSPPALELAKWGFIGSLVILCKSWMLCTSCAKRNVHAGQNSSVVQIRKYNLLEYEIPNRI